jgi:hypothetical protein
MKDRILTIVLSVITTIVVMNLMQWIQRGPQRAMADDASKPVDELVVDRLIVRQELIVSDTGQPWEEGFERQQIPRGMVARSLYGGGRSSGIWVRGRLIKTEIDDPFDDRFHAINSDGSMVRMPGHLSWNVWINDAWRQLAIVEGEALEFKEMPLDQWSGDNHPGRLRFQSFRPHFEEPFTDVIIGQGMMSIGGGGYGGEGLPYPSEVLQLWGGKLQQTPVPIPPAPDIMKDDGAGEHTYAVIAIGPQGQRSAPSPTVTADGRATLAWDRVAGADQYIIVRDGQEGKPIRIDGMKKQWTDTVRAAAGAD